MRIKEIHIYQKNQPIIGGPYVMSTMSLSSLDAIILKVVTDTGLVGWGEVTPLGPAYQAQHAMGAVAAMRELAPGLIGQNALAPKVLMRHLDELLNGHNYAKAPFDFALMDILGKHYGVRVVDLLGGVEQEQLPAYYAISRASPAETARQAVDKADQGYARLQIKVGGRSVDEDIEAVKKTYEAVGHRVTLVADANRGMNTSQAKRLSLACRDIPFIFEQPCNTMEEIAAIRSQISQPIALDECINDLHDVTRAISMNACDAFGMKLTRVGGLLAMSAIRDLCEAHNMPHTCDDSWGGDILAAAILHMAASTKPRQLEGVWIATDYIEESYDPDNAIRVADAKFALPTGLGLGIEPDESRIGELVASFD